MSKQKQSLQCSLRTMGAPPILQDLSCKVTSVMPPLGQYSQVTSLDPQHLVPTCTELLSHCAILTTACLMPQLPVNSLRAGPCLGLCWIPGIAFGTQ